MPSEINNAKCAQHMLNCMEDVDFSNTRKTKYCCEWVKIKDNFPQTLGLYVCLMKDGHDEFGIFGGFFRTATLSKSFDGKYRFYSRCEDITDDIDYWMLLPELPK